MFLSHFQTQRGKLKIHVRQQGDWTFLKNFKDWNTVPTFWYIFSKTKEKHEKQNLNLLEKTIWQTQLISKLTWVFSKTCPSSLFSFNASICWSFFLKARNLFSTEVRPLAWETEGGVPVLVVFSCTSTQDEISPPKSSTSAILKDWIPN